MPERLSFEQAAILHKQEQLLFGRDVVGFFDGVTMYSIYIYSAVRYTHLEIRMQDEFTVLGWIIVPSRGWKSLNIWEQL